MRNFVLIGLAGLMSGAQISLFWSNKAPDPVHPIARDSLKVDQDDKVLSNITAGNLTTSEAPHEDTFSLIVVRCQKNVTWLDQVPTDWRIIVYDKCGTNTAEDFPLPNMIRYEAENFGSEECSTYINYMVDFYHNLSDVNIFVHDDALRSWSAHKGDWSHTPFDTFPPLADAIKQFLTPEQPFLHLGIHEMTEAWGKENYHGEAMKIMWPYFDIPDDTTSTTTTAATPASNDPSHPPPPLTKRHKLAKPPKSITYKPGAHFAVRKSQILMRPKHSYYPILKQLHHSKSVPDYQQDERMFCCAMERSWHILFGQPPVLPSRAIITDLLNITKCNWCRILAHVND